MLRIPSLAWPFGIALLVAFAPAMCESAPAATSAISHEPLYAGLVAKARRLKRETEGFDRHPTLDLLTQPKFQAYARDIRALSDGDQAGHMDLKARGTDNDLKCILKGVSLDLPNKLNDIQASTTPDGLSTALGKMTALLTDNIDVIVTPATAESGLDCVIEFGNS